MSTLVPRLFVGLVDDASVLPPSFAAVPDAAAAYRGHSHAWYAPLLGSLLVPASQYQPVPALSVALIGDVAPAALPALVPADAVRSVEAAVARRGEDPQPGLVRLRDLAAGFPSIDVYAEIPLSWGLLAALDTVAGMRQDGARIAPKFRVGGLAAELFPTPVELAAVIIACRDRGLPFKLAAGLRHALRHTDPETGFTHHGFLNVLVAVLSAADGAEVADVAEVLAATHPLPLVEPCRARLDTERPLWGGFGTANVVEPLTDLVRLGLISAGHE